MPYSPTAPLGVAQSEEVIIEQMMSRTQRIQALRLAWPDPEAQIVDQLRVDEECESRICSGGQRDHAEIEIDGISVCLLCAEELARISPDITQERLYYLLGARTA